MVRQFLIPCNCNKGFMSFRCAGPNAKFPGRYYYICPRKVEHRLWFIWADSVWDDQYVEIRQYLTPAHEVADGTPNFPAESGCSQRTHISKPRERSEMSETAEVGQSSASNQFTIPGAIGTALNMNSPVLIGCSFILGCLFCLICFVFLAAVIMLLRS